MIVQVVHAVDVVVQKIIPTLASTEIGEHTFIHRLGNNSNELEIKWTTKKKDRMVPNKMTSYNTNDQC